MKRFWQGLMTGGLIGGAFGAYLLRKSSLSQEEFLDTAMEKTAGPARVFGRSASKVGSHVVKVGQSALGAVHRSKVRS